MSLAGVEGAARKFLACLLSAGVNSVCGMQLVETDAEDLCAWSARGCGCIVVYLFVAALQLAYGDSRVAAALGCGGPGHVVGFVELTADDGTQCAGSGGGDGGVVDDAASGGLPVSTRGASACTTGCVAASTLATCMCTSSDQCAGVSTIKQQSTIKQALIQH